MVATALNHDVYYRGLYWNDYETVRTELNRRATGSTELIWQDHFQSSTKAQFSKALIINCGNGWVERELFDRGLFKEAVAFDASEALLQQAEEKRAGRSIRYLKVDGNQIGAENIGAGFDLVVNHAACHHIGRLFRFMRIMSEVLVPGGIMLNWDYVGSDRNQYPYPLWEKVMHYNDHLPEFARADLTYPHLPTMLATDPSEAIRSSMILPAFRKYFEVEHLGMLGGGLAYPLMTHNYALAKLPHAQSLPIIKQILIEDDSWCRAHPDHNLFAYWWGKPLSYSKKCNDSVALERIESSWFNEHANTIQKHELTLLQRLTQRLCDLESVHK